MVAGGLFDQRVGGGVDGVYMTMCVCVLYLLPTYRD